MAFSIEKAISLFYWKGKIGHISTIDMTDFPRSNKNTAKDNYRQ